MVIETDGQVSERIEHYSNTFCNSWLVSSRVSSYCIDYRPYVASLLYRALQNVLFFHPMEIPTLNHPTTTTQ